MTSKPSLRVLSLLPVVGHPRESKRIDMLLATGAEVKAAAFSRDRPTSRAPRCSVADLGRVEDGHYWRRIPSALSALGKVIGLSRDCDVVYASGQDMALIGLCAKLITGVPVVLEVGDLREIQLAKGLRGWLVRILERYICRNVAFLVVTSELFITRYYEPLVAGPVEYLVLENKLEPDFAREVTYRPKASLARSADPIIIGFFGMLRFQWSLDALHTLLVRNPDRFRLLLAGYSAGDVDMEPLLALKDQVRYVGRYRSPEDLPELYGQIDLTWCAYPVTGSGHTGKDMVRANRFYEACLFKTPLVVLRGTGDASAVDTLGIGLVLDPGDLESVSKQVEAIERFDLSGWAEAMAALPERLYIRTDDEQEALGERMHAAAKRGR